MGALSPLPVSLPSLLRHQRTFRPKPHSSASLFFLYNAYSINLSPSSPSREPFTIRSTNGGRKYDDESVYLDEDGVVDDMDGYLNYLSLEYDSVWDTKPSWCQPWTILLTGVTVVACSWLFLHSAIISAGVFSIISAWWYIFLYAYPKESVQSSTRL